MKRRTSMRSTVHSFLAALAVVLVTACAIPDTQDEAVAEAPASAAPASVRPVVLTQLKVEKDNCTPEFENNNCGGNGDPGDICIAGGSNSNPTKASLKFVVAGPGAGEAKIQKMTISLASNGTCPTDVQDDFPDFGTDCVYAPGSPGNVLQVKDDNEVTRTWNYTLTVKARNECTPVTIHPIIDNGGGNSSSDEDPPPP